jgi:hypothetical protein
MAMAKAMAMAMDTNTKKEAEMASEMKRARLALPGSVMFLDLETLPGGASVGMSLQQAPGWVASAPVVAARAVPQNYKDPAKVAAWQAKEAERVAAEAVKVAEQDRAAALEHWKRGALRFADARIACIGYAFGDGQAQTFDASQSELAALQWLDALIQDRQPERIVAHNGSGFDFPMVQIRAMKHGLYSLAGAFHVDKPWDQRMVDTLAWWPGRYSKGGSLDTCAEVLGISRAANPISGGQVLDAYVGGRWADVVAHCVDDINVLREVYRALWEVRGGV